MDSLSQAVLGASVGGAVLARPLGRRALLGGALLGTLPDLDVLIDYGDAVANFTEHRGFSHSLLVLLPVSLLLALCLSRWQTQIPLRRWWLFTGLCLITHPLLDAFTTYGTQLFWPLGDPVAISSVFIIDPLYTLPLLIAVLWAVAKPPAGRVLIGGLAVSSLYLAWSVAAQYAMTQRVMPALAERGLSQAPRLVQPMPFSTLLWRITVLGEQQRLEILTGILDGDAPLQVEAFPRDTQRLAAIRALPAGRTLLHFTRGFVAADEQKGRLLATDIRLGLPGLHPFQFVLAERQPDGWHPLAASQRMPRPMTHPEAWPALLARTLSQSTLWCLSTLSAPGKNGCPLTGAGVDTLAPAGMAEHPLP
ncbi:metal-dependent hydrolase [Alcanivorax sp. VBW004]|jgi:inner membrane protein|uniref:metal-dependent hydrolase n=3 Tax=Alcanivorax TaxID=59753 RepID=UPI0012BC83DA|nr:MULTISPECIES: metal-dependent hydrolase [unclassified Alcanivorax]MTT51430.1 metal-dependent hydrolase [Alcanivorax sp. VBW004]